MVDTSVTVKVCGVTLGVNERRRLTCPSGLLNDKVSWWRQLLWQRIDIVCIIWYYDLKWVIAAYMRLIKLRATPREVITSVIWYKLGSDTIPKI